jgi:hypothetical protein
MRRRFHIWISFALLTTALATDPLAGRAVVKETVAVESIAQRDSERASPRARGDGVIRASFGPAASDFLDTPNVASVETSKLATSDGSSSVTPPEAAVPPAAAPAPVVRAAVPAPVVRAAAPLPVARTAAPAVVRTPAVATPPPPATCPADRFCYPRVGISGTIVPYGDCTGSTDVGTAIRSLSCVSPTYLAAHAYTQFGRITGWRAGDIVFAYGVRYVLYDAFTQNGCAAPARALAPLSLQTSLTATSCGAILVVQGRPA